MGQGRRTVWWLLGVCVLRSVLSEDTLGVAVFNEFGAPRTDSWMQFRGEVPTMKQFTVCVRVRFFQFLTPSTIISYAVPNCDDELFLNYDVRFSRLVVGCCNREVSFDFQVRILPQRWKTFCVRVDLNVLTAQLFQDGDPKSLSQQLETTPSRQFHIRGGGELFIGQDQDKPGGKFDPYESLKAKLADLQLVSQFMNSSDLIKFTQMQELCEKSCAFLSFDTFDIFRLSNVETSKVDRKSNQLENEQIPFIRLFSHRVQFNEAQSLCHALGGKIYLPKNHFENEALFQLTSTNPNFCDGIIYSKDTLWLGAVTNGPNASWTEYLSKKLLNFTKLSNADDIRTSNSDFALTFVGCESNSSNSRKTWSLTTTSQSRRVACEFDSVPLIKLRGILPDIRLDNDYFLEDKLIDPNLIGYRTSSLTALKGDNTEASRTVWHLKNFWINETVLSFKSSYLDFYPFGTKEWIKPRNDVKISLMFTACRRGEFTCSDGSCVDTRKRCNLERDCLDGSDEETCSIVRLRKSEEKSRALPPPKPKGKRYFELIVGYDIVWVHDLDLTSFTVISDVVVKTMWHDPGKSFLNLKKERQLNLILHADFSKMWKPTHVLAGDSSTLSIVENFKEEFYVERRSGPQADDLEHLTADEIFAGADNPVVSRQSFTVKTKCNIHLERFPFDSQVCQVVISWQCNMRDVRLLPLYDGKFVQFSGERKLLQYSVHGVFARVMNKSACPALLVEIAFKNRSVYYVFYTYLPSLMLMIVGYMTFYFPLNDFQDRIMVALTAMLVQTTFFTQVGDHLPRTAYLKLIDVWCVLCIAMLFCIILSIVMINHFYESARGKKKSPISSRSKIGVPYEKVQSLDPMDDMGKGGQEIVPRSSKELAAASAEQKQPKNSEELNITQEGLECIHLKSPTRGIRSAKKRLGFSNAVTSIRTEQKTCWVEDLAPEPDKDRTRAELRGSEVSQFAVYVNACSAWCFACLIATLIVAYTAVALSDSPLW